MRAVIRLVGEAHGGFVVVCGSDEPDVVRDTKNASLLERAGAGSREVFVRVRRGSSRSSAESRSAKYCSGCEKVDLIQHHDVGTIHECWLVRGRAPARTSFRRIGAQRCCSDRGGPVDRASRPGPRRHPRRCCLTARENASGRLVLPVPLMPCRRRSWDMASPAKNTRKIARAEIQRLTGRSGSAAMRLRRSSTKWRRSDGRSTCAGRSPRSGSSSIRDMALERRTGGLLRNELVEGFLLLVERRLVRRDA